MQEMDWEDKEHCKNHVHAHVLDICKSNNIQAHCGFPYQDYYVDLRGLILGVIETISPMYKKSKGELDKVPKSPQIVFNIYIQFPWYTVNISSTEMKVGRKTITFSTVCTNIFVLLSIV